MLLGVVVFHILVCLVQAQNFAQHPTAAIELGKTAKLQRVSHNYYVTHHNLGTVIPASAPSSSPELLFLDTTTFHWWKYIKNTSAIPRVA